MKNTLFLVITFITLTISAQEKTCLDFKTGNFKYSDPDYADLISVRKDSFQIDTYPKINLELRSSVKWLTDCKYEIEYISVNNTDMEALIGVKYIIEIIKIEDNKIICKTESEGIVVEKEMILINKL